MPCFLQRRFGLVMAMSVAVCTENLIRVMALGILAIWSNYQVF
jgi:hypothetical protein